MDRYPSLGDATRDSWLHRISEWFVTAGVGALVAIATIALSGGPSGPIGWVLATVVILLGSAGFCLDNLRNRRLDAREWSEGDFHLLREKEYGKRGGIFLTHTAVPSSRTDGNKEWWKVAVHLVQHRTGPLSDGAVKEVLYSFGPKFKERPVRSLSPQDGFRYETEMYGPVLVVGRVVFKNLRKSPLILVHYIDIKSNEIGAEPPRVRTGWVVVVAAVAMARLNRGLRRNRRSEHDHRG